MPPKKKTIGSKPPPPPLPLWVEGGFINDQSGEATKKERERLRIGNPAMKKFSP